MLLKVTTIMATAIHFYFQKITPETPKAYPVFKGHKDF